MGDVYAPWRDDALLPEESAFSLVSKVAWFHATPAVEYLFEHQSGTGQWKKAPKVVRLHKVNWREPFLIDPQRQPLIDGRPLAAELAERSESDPVWLSCGLRHCPICLRNGIHLRIHQHRAVLQCPLHCQPLSTRCPHCATEVYLVFHRGVPSFTCPSCRKGWLHRELDPFRYDEAFRSRVAHANAHVHEMLINVLPKGRVHCGISNPELTDQELETPWTGQVLWLGANATRFMPHPPWLRVAALPAGIAVDCGQVSLRQVAQQNGGNSEPWNVAHQLPVGNFVRLEKNRLRTAVRRVATIGRAQCAPAHTDCLELPYRLFGQSSTVSHDDYDDLMGCCPVALGFWLWRQAAAAMLERIELENYIHAPTRGCDLDRMCYLNAKSHLHYCIACAAECIRLGRQDRASSWAEMLLLLAKSEWNPLVLDVRIGNESGWWLGFDDHAWNLRFRASTLIASLPCSGIQSYAAHWVRIVALMRRSRRRIILGPDDATTPDCWFRRLEPPSKISANDLRDFTPQSARPEFCRTHLGIPVLGYCIVDAAINERGADTRGEASLGEETSIMVRSDERETMPFQHPRATNQHGHAELRDGIGALDEEPSRVPVKLYVARRKLQPSSDDILIIKGCSAAEAARRCGRSKHVIRRWRAEILGLNVAVCSELRGLSPPVTLSSKGENLEHRTMRRTKIKPTPSDIAAIKNCSNVMASKICQRSMATIRRWRKEFLGVIPTKGRPKNVLPPDLISSLGQYPDAELARRFNLPKHSIRNYRMRRGIPAMKRHNKQTS